MEGDVQGVLSHMIGLMEEEVKAFRNLLDALLEQRKALVQGDEGGFVRSVHRKAEILERTQRLEDEKEEVVRDLAGRLDLPSERPTLHRSSQRWRRSTPGGFPNSGRPS